MNRGEVRIEDVAGLQSRVSWGAILAGSVIALAVSLLLGLFFAGVGLSLSETDLRANQVGWGAVAAAVLTMAVSLFCGGCVTTQLTAGETRREAMIHGILTWAVVVGFTLVMVGMGMRAGYNALLGTALVGQNAAAGNTANWEQLARDAGVPQARIEEMRRDIQTAPDRARAEANNPDTREAARQGALTATWAVFAGTLLSIGAAVLGALSGMGPTFRLFPAAVVAERRETTVVRS